MPGPGDYVTVPSPHPASYAAPLLGFGIGDRIADLPNQYYQGTQMARTRALQNAFPNGLPRDAQGNIDVNSLTDTLTKLGGAEYATQVLPLLIEGQIGQAGASAVEGMPGTTAAPTTGAEAAPVSSTANVPGASGPANIRGPAKQRAISGDSTTPGQPQLSTVGADNGGADTVRSVATETFGGRDVSPLIPRYAAAIGVKPDDPLTPQQVNQVRALMSRTAQAQMATMPTATDTTGGGAFVNPPQAGGATSGGATSGAPAPNGGNAPTTAMPSTGIVPQAPPTQNAPAQVPGVPPGYNGDPSAYANALLAYANGLHRRATQFAAFKGGQAMSQSLENQAKAAEDRAKQIFDFMGTAAQPTTEQKNLASNATARTKEVEGEVAQGQKTYNGLQGMASQYESDLKPYLDLSRSILNDPRMYAGSGANLVLDWNRVKAAMGGDPRAAMLQEAMQKVTAGSVLSQINNQRDQLMEAGGTAGRIFASQIEQVEKASPQLSTTLGGNRFLVEVQSRIGTLAETLRDMAVTYRQQNGHLDAGFDKQMGDYMKAHPLFTKQELGNPALLGAPTAPTGLTKEQAVQWGASLGLKPGDPVRTGTSYSQIPRLTIPLTPGNVQ